MNDEFSSTNELDDVSVVDEQWIASELKMHMDSNVEALDFNVTSKLSSARHRALALEAAPNKKTWFRPTSMRPVLFSGAVVVAISFFLGAQLMPHSSDQQITTKTQMAQSDLLLDMNIFMATEDLEFFESIEFLEWMASN